MKVKQLISELIELDSEMDVVFTYWEHNDSGTSFDVHQSIIDVSVDELPYPSKPNHTCVILK